MLNQMIPQQNENCNAIIKVTYGDRPTVSARELHEFLDVGTDFRHWFPRMTEYGFSEDADYTPVIFDHPQNKLPTSDFQITLDMAKEISMIQRTEKGKQARQYFIAVEKQSRPQPMTQIEILQNSIGILAEQDKRLRILESSNIRLESKIQTALEKPVIVDWCKWINDKVNMVVESQGFNHQKYRGDLYAELEETARCNLEARQTQLRRRMREAGHTYKECKAVSKLHVVDADVKLKAIFENIVKRESARYA